MVEGGHFFADVLSKTEMSSMALLEKFSMGDIEIFRHVFNSGVRMFKTNRENCFLGVVSYKGEALTHFVGIFGSSDPQLIDVFNRHASGVKYFYSLRFEDLPLNVNHKEWIVRFLVTKKLEGG